MLFLIFAGRRLAHLVPALLILALAAPASAAVTRAQAGKAAVEAFQVSDRSSGEIVFAADDTLPVGAVIREASPEASGGDTTNDRAIVSTPLQRIATIRKHRAWLFYDDRAPFQAYQHAGRVALVDVQTGAVTLTRTLDWPPLIGHRLPSFMRTAAAYRDEANRVFYRPYGASAQRRASGLASIWRDAFGPRFANRLEESAAAQRAADLLAAEGSCAVRMSDTLFGELFDYGVVSRTRQQLGLLLLELSGLNHGFHSGVYFARNEHATPAGFIRSYIARHKCQDVLLYLAGSGVRGKDTVNVGMLPRGGRLEHQDISVGALRDLIKAHPRVTFKLVVDAPYSGDFGRLADLPNVLLTATPSGAKRGAFVFLPEFEKDGKFVENTTNGQGLLEFTNRLLGGLEIVLADPNEVTYAAQLQSQGKIKSTLAWFLARALDRGETLDFANYAGTQQDPNVSNPAGEPPAGGPTPVGDFNRPPVADPQTVSLAENSAKAITLTGSDPDRNAFGYGVISGPSHGTLGGTPPNLVYVPATGYHGADSFTFGTFDGAVASAPATVSITVTSVNDPPVAVDDSATGDEDHVLNVSAANGVLANDSDADGDPLTVTQLNGFDSLTHSTAKGAAVTLHPDGSFSYDPTGSSVLQALAVGEHATDSFTYTVSDGQGGTSVATATITVTGVNDIPQATADTGTIARNLVLNVPAKGLLANDSDVDSSDALTVTSFNGGLPSGTTAKGASVTLHPDGSYSYDPTGSVTLGALAHGQSTTDPFTYTVSDGHGGSDTKTVTITVNGIDHAPVAGDDSSSTDEDTVKNVTAGSGVLGNDTDADSDPLSAVAATGTSAKGAAFTVNADGSYSYDPTGSPTLDALPVGSSTPDTFDYTVDDGFGGTDTGTVTVTVDGVNDTPTAADDSGFSTGEDSVLSGATNVLANDTDPDSGETAGLVTTAAATTSAKGAAVTVNPDGSWSYDPTGSATLQALKAGQSTTDTFGYKVKDVHNATSGLATVTVTVNGANDAPVATADSHGVTEGGTLSISAANGLVQQHGSDVDGDTLTAVLVAAPAHASSFTLNSDGSFSYTHDGTDTGDDSFTYKLNDGTANSNTATVSLPVTAVNDAPVAVADSATVAEGGTLSKTAGTGVLANDSDEEGNSLTATLVTGPAHASSFTLNSDGSYDYTHDGSETTSDSFTYKANDGALDGNTVTVSLTITPVNNAPTITAGGTLNYTENDAATAIDTTVAPADVDNPTLSSATVQITGNYLSGQDVLSFVDTGTITGNWDSGTGTMTLSGIDSIANYQAALRAVKYRNSSDNPSTSARTVTYKVNDGALDSSGATSTINVAAVNDPPTATDQSSVAATEDTAKPITLSGSDPENDALSFTHDATSAQGGTISGSGSSVSYAPAADYCGADSFGFTADDGNGGTDSGTISLDVACVNDLPVVDLNGSSAGTGTNPTFLEVLTHDNSVTLAPSATVTDVDDTDIKSATVTLTVKPDGAGESLAATGTSNITVDAYDSSTGVLFLHGTAPKSEYAQVLQSVTYSNTAAPPSATDRPVTFTVKDAHDADSASATSTVQVVPLNTPPVVLLDSPNPDSTVTFTEDSPAVNIAPNPSITDADASDTDMESATITLTNRPDGANESLATDATGTSGITVDAYNASTGVLYLHGHGTVADYETLISRTKYDNASQNPDTTDRDVTVVVNDGQADSTTRHATVHVNRHNDPITNTVPGGQSSNEDAVLTFSTGNSNLISIADADAGSGSVQVTVSASHGTLNANIPAGGTRTGDGTGSLQLTGTVSAINTVLDGMTYTPDANYNGSDTLTVASDDQGNSGGAATTDSDNVALTINAVNDGPSNTVPLAQQSVNEDTALTFNTGNSNKLSTSDIDAGANSVKVTLSANNGAVTLSGTSGLSFACVGCAGDGSGDTTMTFTGTVANVNTALDGLSYQGTLNYNGSDTLTLIVNDQGNTGSGGALSATSTVGITVNPVNDAPVAGDETFNATNSAVGNTTLNVNDTATTGAGAADGRPPTPDPTDTSPTTDRPHKEITGNIFANDTDVDNNSNEFTAVPGTFATNDGGTVTIQADGDFNFEPAPSTSCTDHSDFFDYTVSDNVSSGAGPNPGTDTGRVTVAITGCVWYVNNNDAQGNSGTSEKPFDTLAQAQTASGNGDTTFVYDGDDTTTGYNAGYTMNTNETLLSEGATLTIGSDTLHTADAANKASITNNNADVVTLAGGATVKSFNIDPQGTGGGIYGTGLGATTVTLDDLNVVDNGTKGTQPGLELDTNTGTTTNISNFTVNNGDGSSATTGDEGVKLNATGTVNFASTGTISITTNGAAGLDAAAGAGTTSLGSASTFDDITVTNSGTGGVKLSGTTGSGTAFGDGSGNDLQLTTTTGAPAAFSVQTAGSFSVPSAGQSDISATGGPAVDVVSSSGSTMAFDGVSSTNSANDGVNIDSIGTGTFSATSGTIGGEAGIGFDLNGGSGAITDPATFNNGTGSLVAEVTGRTGGVVSLAGSMNDTNDAGGGVNIANNTGGSTVFSGATKQYNTGASDAVTFSNSDGHTFVLSGGGTDIDTTSGNGINATTSGTFQVSGSGNTLDSTALSASNRGLNIADTDLSATGVTFDHINTSGGTNGIRLNNTGSTGAFTVTGVGGTCTGADQSGCSGGVIQSATGAGIAMANVGKAASLTRMNVKSNGTTAGSGISGSSVNDLTLANTVLSGNGTQASDDGIQLTNLTGTAAWTNLSVTGSAHDNVSIDNSSGTLSNLSISGASHFDSLGTTFGSNSFLLQIRGTATLTQGTIDGATFSNNQPARGITVQAQNTANIGDASTNAFVVKNSTFTNNGLQASFEQSGSANMTFQLLNNTPMTMNGAASTADAVNVFSSSTTTGGRLYGRIQGNSIGSAGTAGSGSPNGAGIVATLQGHTDTRLLLDSNTIRQTPNWRGIDIQTLGPQDSSNAGPFDVTVTNNDVNNNAPVPASGLADIYVAADSQGGGSVTTRTSISGNTVPNTTNAESSGDLYLDRPSSAATCLLVGSGSATSQLAGSNTGSVFANVGCTTFAGPIGTPP